MTRFFAVILIFAASVAQAQDRYGFGYTHSDDGTPADAVQLVTDHGTFFAFGRGWVDQTGFHHAANDNYIVGRYQQTWYRNFFVFDLRNALTPFVRATLRLYNPSFTGPTCYPGPACLGYQSTEPAEAFFLRFVRPAFHGDLFRHASGRTDLFGALAVGPAIGTRSLTADDNGRYVDIDLNRAGLDHLNDRRGDLWAAGGSLDDEIGTTVTPEPATLALTATGLIALALARRSRRSARPW